LLIRLPILAMAMPKATMFMETKHRVLGASHVRDQLISVTNKEDLKVMAQTVLVIQEANLV